MITKSIADRSTRGREILFFLLLFIAFPCFAQDSLLLRKVSLTLEEVTLEDALDTIGRQTGTNFTYNAKLFKFHKPINLKVNKQRIDSVLRSILPDTTLQFYVVNQQIIISPRKKKEKREVYTSADSGFIEIDLQIQGKIVNKNNHKPLSFASIGIMGKPVGTISNEEGDFVLKVPTAYQKDTLVISYVGFGNRYFPIADLNTKSFTVEMQKEFISLQEIFIRSSNPYSIIRSAIRKIKQNYYQKPAELTTFYRETVKKNKHFMIYLEAVMTIYKNAYDGNSRVDLAKVYKSRKIYDVNRMDTISLRLKGGVADCLKLDIVKNPPSFLKEENLQYFNYILEDICSYDNHSVYLIAFEPKDNILDPLFKGRLYVDTRSLAIIRAEFYYPSHMVKKMRNQVVVKKSAKVKVMPTRLDYIISFRQINGKYYLNHVKGQLNFKVRHRRKLFASNFALTLEMATTQLDTSKIKRYQYRKILKPHTVFSKEKFAYDVNFWGNQNFIQPEENIQDALKRINSRMQKIARQEEKE